MTKRIATIIAALVFTSTVYAASMTAFSAETITVTTTATSVTSLLSTAGGRRTAAQCVKIKVPTSGVTVYVGASDVTAAATAASRAYPLNAGDEISLPVPPALVFLRVAAATQVVHVIFGNNC